MPDEKKEEKQEEKQEEKKDEKKDEKKQAPQQNELGKKVQAFMDWCIKTSEGPALYVWGAHGPDNYDCTGFLSCGLQAAGFDMPPCHGTAFDDNIQAAGFTLIPYDDSQGTAPLMPGDVLSNPNHVELYIGNGNVVGAHSAHKAAAEQVSVEPWFADNWTEIYRCTGATGVTNADGSTAANAIYGSIGPAKSSDGGFRITSKGGDMVHIIKLPDKKTFCEPIYPDYVTVSDTVPQWVLDQSVAQANADSAQANGTKIPDGDAKEKAPNGMHYYENDIKYLMENNQGMTREKAIEILSKDKKYTRKVKQEQDGTFTVVEEDATNDSNNKKGSNESSSKNGGGKTSAEWEAEAEEHIKKSKHYVELAEQVKNEMRERYKAETGKSDVTDKELVDVWAKANASDLAKKYHDLYEKAINEDRETRRCQNESVKALKLN